MGMQFFDVAVYAIGSGGVCLAVYRGLQGEDFGAIWAFPDAPSSTAAEVALGAVVGAIAGVVGIAFRRWVHSTASCGGRRLPAPPVARSATCARPWLWGRVLPWLKETKKIGRRRSQVAKTLTFSPRRTRPPS